MATRPDISFHPSSSSSAWFLPTTWDTSLCDRQNEFNDWRTEDDNIDNGKSWVSWTEQLVNNKVGYFPNHHPPNPSQHPSTTLPYKLCENVYQKNVHMCDVIWRRKVCVCDVKGANWTFVKKKYSFQKKNIFTKFFKDFQKTLKTSLSFVTVSRMYLQLSLNNLASATPSTVVMLTPTQTWPPCVTTTTTTTKRQKLRIFLKSTFQNRTGKTVQHWSLILVSTYARKKTLFLKKYFLQKKMWCYLVAWSLTGSNDIGVPSTDLCSKKFRIKIVIRISNKSNVKNPNLWKKTVFHLK